MVVHQIPKSNSRIISIENHGVTGFDGLVKRESFDHVIACTFFDLSLVQLESVVKLPLPQSLLSFSELLIKQHKEGLWRRHQKAQNGEEWINTVSNLFIGDTRECDNTAKILLDANITRQTELLLPHSGIRPLAIFSEILSRTLDAQSIGVFSDASFNEPAGYLNSVVRSLNSEYGYRAKDLLRALAAIEIGERLLSNVFVINTATVTLLQGAIKKILRPKDNATAVIGESVGPEVTVSAQRILEIVKQLARGSEANNSIFQQFLN